jgi:hypothetical protein
MFSDAQFGLVPDRSVDDGRADERAVHRPVPRRDLERSDA